MVGDPYHLAIALSPASSPTTSDPLDRLSGGERFPTIDGLRTMSALAVLVFHVASVSALNAGGYAGEWTNLLSGGVTVFFVLSGFLLYRPFVAARLTGTPSPATVPFYWRRFLRILPAYWLALLVATYVMHTQQMAWPGDFLRYWFLLQNFWVGTTLGGLVVAWSLAAELCFYLYLPAHAWFLRRFDRPGTTLEERIRSEYLMCAALTVLSIGFKCIILVSKAKLGSAWMPSYLDIFAIGMALAVASVAARERGGPGPWMATVVDAPARLWLGAALVYAALVMTGMPVAFAPISMARYLVRQEGLGLVALLLVAPMVLATTEGGRLRAVLGSRAAGHMGDLSYAIYLWHLPVILYAYNHFRGHHATLPFWVLLGLTLVGTLPLAVATWVLVERPSRALRNRGPGAWVRGRKGLGPPAR